MKAAKGKSKIAKLAKTKPAKAMKKPQGVAGLAQMMQGPPQTLGQAFGP